MRHPVLLLLPTAALILAACGGGGDAPPKYESTIQRTSYGVPHVNAKNLGGVAYGMAYAYAQDNLCLLADQILTVNGERSKFLGPDVAVRAGSGLTNIKSDFVFTYLLDEAGQRRVYASMSDEAKEMIGGYVAGYNRFVRESAGKLPAPCTGAAWVRPITDLDMFRLTSEKALQSGLGNFIEGIHAATPPAGALPLAKRSKPTAMATEFAAAYAKRPELGSNAYGLGKDATENGSGMLLGNPHFPWSTTNRFYQFHLTVPGSVDVMGAALAGFPMVNIGFNKDVAWSHTVSTARRFTLFELSMQDGTSYLVDGVAKPLTKTTVSVAVRETGGAISTRTHDFYATADGPLLVGNGLGWTQTKAFAIRDANAENGRMLDQWLQMARANSVGELKTRMQQINGLPWVNTIAADRAGDALYADISVTPNVSAAKLGVCSTSPTARAFAAQRVYMLDGSTASCAWDVDPASGAPLYPPSTMPQLTRNDYVANSNESGWLANPAQLITGFSPIVGLQAKEQSQRTRMAFTQLADRLSGTDGKAGNRFSLANLESIYFDARSYSAEQTVDKLVELCEATPTATSTAGNAVDLAPACATLKAWDKRMNFDAVGVPVFREFWRTALKISSLWAVPFDATDPVNTPTGLNTTAPAVAGALLKALADSVETLAANGIAMTTKLGEVQYVVSPANVRIPIDGGDEFEGTFNKMTPLGLSAAGYTPIVSGSSYIQAVTFDGSGPVARGILTYSQSTDPTSPHYADQTALYGTGRFVALPFLAVDIAKDPNLKTQKIRE